MNEEDEIKLLEIEKKLLLLKRQGAQIRQQTRRIEQPDPQIMEYHDSDTEAYKEIDIKIPRLSFFGMGNKKQEKTQVMGGRVLECPRCKIKMVDKNVKDFIENEIIKIKEELYKDGRA